MKKIINKSLLLLLLFVCYISCGEKKDTNNGQTEVTKIFQYAKNGRRIIDVKNKSLKENELVEALYNHNQDKVLSLMKNLKTLNFQYSDGNTILSHASYNLMDRVVYAIIDSDFEADTSDEIFELNPMQRLIMKVDLDELYYNDDRLHRFRTIYNALEKFGYKVDQNINRSNFDNKMESHPILFWTMMNSHYDLALQLINSKDYRLSKEKLRDIWSYQLRNYDMSLDLGKLKKHIKYEYLDEFLIESTKQVDPDAIYFENIYEKETNRDYYLKIKELMIGSNRRVESKEVLKRIKNLFKRLDHIIL